MQKLLQQLLLSQCYAAADAGALRRGTPGRRARAEPRRPGREHVLREVTLADTTLPEFRYIPRGTGKATRDVLFNFFS